MLSLSDIFSSSEVGAIGCDFFPYEGWHHRVEGVLCIIFYFCVILDMLHCLLLTYDLGIMHLKVAVEKDFMQFAFLLQWSRL